MNNSVEVEMTDKETVLKVWPRAYAHSPMGGWWYIDIYRDTAMLGEGNSEEAAWQNAAESLPPQPVQDDPYACSYTTDGEHVPTKFNDCLYCGSRGRHHLLRPEPVAAPAPVEDAGDEGQDANQEKIWYDRGFIDGKLTQEMQNAAAGDEGQERGEWLKDLEDKANEAMIDSVLYKSFHVSPEDVIVLVGELRDKPTASPETEQPKQLVADADLDWALHADLVNEIRQWREYGKASVK